MEEWSFGLRTIPDAPLDKAELQGIAESARGGFGSSGLLGLMPANVVIQKVRAAWVKADGRVLQAGDGSYFQHDAPYGGNDGVGGSGTHNMPTQVALVASLMTSRAGPTGKGRIFLPWPAITPGTDFIITSAQAQTVANAVRTLVDGISTFDNVVSVVSEKGYASPVTGVRVGRVPDTMRSRRHRRSEGYAIATL